MSARNIVLFVTVDASRQNDEEIAEIMFNASTEWASTRAGFVPRFIEITTAAEQGFEAVEAEARRLQLTQDEGGR